MVTITRIPRVIGGTCSLGMLYDFHIHTSEYSACSISSAQEICETAVEAGLAGIALTEHNVWWPLDEVERLRRSFPDLTIFRGLECGCPEGHFLVFLPEIANEKPYEWCSVLDLIHAVHNLGGIVIWAHPFRYDRTWPDWLSCARLDGMEITSSNMDHEACSLARNAAAEKGIMVFNNSDAHHADFLGRYGNELNIVLDSVEDLIRYVQ